MLLLPLALALSSFVMIYILASEPDVQPEPAPVSMDAMTGLQQDIQVLRSDSYRLVRDVRMIGK